MSYKRLYKVIYGLNAILIKISPVFSVECKSQSSNSYGIARGPNEPVLKKNKFRGLTLLEFEMSYKAVVIKTVWYWPKDRHK